MKYYRDPIKRKCDTLLVSFIPYSKNLSSPHSSRYWASRSKKKSGRQLRD